MRQILDGWLVYFDEMLGLWSGQELYPIVGLPRLSRSDIWNLRFKLEKGGLIVFPGAGGVEIYFSGDGLRWEPCPTITQDVPKGTFFNLDATIGNVSYTQNNQLYVAERQGIQIFELPEGVRCAAATESGDLVAVGRDCNDKGVLWNQRKMAWILRKGVTEWVPFTPNVSLIQEWTIQYFYEIDYLNGVDPYRYPMIFSGQADGLHGLSMDSIFVESTQGHFCVSRFGLAGIYQFGRTENAIPFFTTRQGNLMLWNGRRFVDMGWRQALIASVPEVGRGNGGVSLSFIGDRVRGLYVVKSKNGNINSIPVLSDNGGRSWGIAKLESRVENAIFLFPFVIPAST